MLVKLSIAKLANVVTVDRFGAKSVILLITSQKTVASREGTFIRVYGIGIPHPHIAYGSTWLEKSVLACGETVRRFVGFEGSEPCATLDIGLAVQEAEGVHHEILDLTLRRVRSGSDAHLGDPDVLVKPRVGGLDVFLESCKVVPRAVPVDANEIYVATLVLDSIEERIHPVEIPNDSRTAQLDAFACPGIYLLHVELRSIIGVHIGLTCDVGLVKGHEMLRSFLVHFSYTTVPLAPFLWAPEHGYVFELGGHLRNGAILPMMVPRKTWLTADIRSILVVCGPSEASVAPIYGRRESECGSEESSDRRDHGEKV